MLAPELSTILRMCTHYVDVGAGQKLLDAVPHHLMIVR
jgi:hypothetical protein